MESRELFIEPGYQEMALDLVTNILSMASKPSAAGEFLTNQIRELTGARTVAIIEYNDTAEKNASTIVSVNPNRRRELVESSEISEIIKICRSLNSIKTWPAKDKSDKAEKYLEKLGLKTSIGIPLKVGEFYVGVVLLLDLPEERHLEKVIQMLEMISTAVALILRNSFLYRQQENIIEQRTLQLQASEQQLRASNQQLIANEQQLRASNQQLRANELEREQLLRTVTAKNKELQSIVYIASHDLKSPLVNIQGFSGELEDNCNQITKILKEFDPGGEVMDRILPLTEEYIPESLKFISASADKMKVLLDGLLHVSRVGTIDINITALDINQIIKNVCDSMEFEFKAKDVEVSIDDLPDCLGDAEMINQLFSNLVGNSLKYLDPDRKGIIHITGTAEDSHCIYCVSDNGIGIVSEHQPKVFELFHRLNPKDSVGGEGLGLTIVTRILDRLNGHIRVESEPGKGSMFFVSLPTV